MEYMAQRRRNKNRNRCGRSIEGFNPLGLIPETPYYNNANFVEQSRISVKLVNVFRNKEY